MYFLLESCRVGRKADIQFVGFYSVCLRFEPGRAHHFTFLDQCVVGIFDIGLLTGFRRGSPVEAIANAKSCCFFAH
jgi:hypothetical protein